MFIKKRPRRDKNQQLLSIGDGVFGHAVWWQLSNNVLVQLSDSYFCQVKFLNTQYSVCPIFHFSYQFLQNRIARSNLQKSTSQPCCVISSRIIRVIKDGFFCQILAVLIFRPVLVFIQTIKLNPLRQQYQDRPWETHLCGVLCIY